MVRGVWHGKGVYLIGEDLLLGVELLLRSEHPLQPLVTRGHRLGDRHHGLLHRREREAAVGVGHDALVAHALRELGKARERGLARAHLAAEGSEGCDLHLGLTDGGGLQHGTGKGVWHEVKGGDSPTEEACTTAQ